MRAIDRSARTPTNYTGSGRTPYTPTVNRREEVDHVAVERLELGHCRLWAPDDVVMVAAPDQIRK